MRRNDSALENRALEIATGPTVRASYPQTCGWCSGHILKGAPVTYTRESGWCHASCTTQAVDAAVD